MSKFQNRILGESCRNKIKKKIPKYFQFAPLEGGIKLWSCVVFSEDIEYYRKFCRNYAEVNFKTGFLKNYVG